ncbi:MAG TPA: MFS transporter [Polyangiales bacterium]|nr:MFS transporter [Polyangiales bacterium]
MNALRLFLFSHYFSLGAVLPLLALALSARGLRPSEYAWILMLIPLSRLLAPPLWGALADLHLGARRLLRANTLLTALALGVTCFATSLAAIAAGFGLWALASSSLVPLVEASAYRMLGASASSFGYIRVFGSMGFAVSALGLGFFGVDPEVRMPFALAAVSYLAAFAATARLPDAELPKRALAPVLRTLARRADMLLLWIGSTVYYLAHGAFDAYFGPHARSLSGASAAAVSAAWAIGVLAEIALIWLVPRWLASRSTRWLLIGSALVAAVRWSLLARASSSVELLALQPLHGVTFGVWYLAFVHENQTGAPSEIRSTVQGVAQACIGAGNLGATLIGGYVLERYGGRVLFDLAAYVALLAAGCYAAREWVLRARAS